MSSHTSMILLIVVLGITTAGVLIMTQEGQNFLNKPQASVREGVQPSVNDLTFVSVVGHNVTAEEITVLRFQIKYEGDDELVLNESFIQFQTEESTADLRYRNGTLAKSIADGYYTQ
jgi:hypothetical protein